jgi:hypothetical protein
MRVMFLLLVDISGFAPCRADESRATGIVSPDRIESIQYSYSRDWSFLDAFESSKVAPQSACGLRFIDGAMHVHGEEERVILVESLGEFCESISPIELAGSYFITAKDIGSHLWVQQTTPVYLWDEDNLILVFEEWLADARVSGTKAPCSGIPLGPHNETNASDTRMCIQVSGY